MGSLSMSVGHAVKAVLIVVAIALCSCGGHLPNSAVSRRLADPYAGALSDATAVPTVIRDRGIATPDIAAPQPLLQQLRDALAKSDPGGAFAGITYDLTYGNMLRPDCVVQSPNRWDHHSRDLTFYPLDRPLPACASNADCNGGTCAAIRSGHKVCLGHSDALVVQVHDLIASARFRVDIALLQPVPDTRFLGAVREALADLARRGRPVTVRLIVGQYPPDNVDVPAFYRALTDGLDLGGVSVAVAAYRSCVASEDCDSYSWNHSKIITVDGIDALVGGHNLWSRDYLIDEPVSDLSMRVRGPAAASAAHFTDRLWDYVCANIERKTSIAVASSSGRCLVPAMLPDGPGKGGLPILAVGRMGAGITKDFANQSELARDLMLGAARHEIRLVQQDLGFGMGRADTLFPDSAIDRLVDFLRQGRGDIYIVLSNLGARGKSGSTYSNDVTMITVARHLRRELQRRFEAHDPLSRYQIRRGPDPVNALLCEHVHMAPYRFGPDASWPGGIPIANHAKFWMVDGRTFHVGSDNMYPVNLQEFGYIVDDPKAAQELSDVYWTPLWQWSSKVAVSGPGVENCIFREVVGPG
jgi:phosphatidylserine/phosphatidylglycerophosphate/cardiolipin synthase-like enzyme